MIMYYKILSQSFEEVKAKNKGLADKSNKSIYMQPNEFDSLKTKISILMTENENMRA